MPENMPVTQDHAYGPPLSGAAAQAGRAMLLVCSSAPTNSPVVTYSNNNAQCPLDDAELCVEHNFWMQPDERRRAVVGSHMRAQGWTGKQSRHDLLTKRASEWCLFSANNPNDIR